MMELREGMRVVIRYRSGDGATDALGTVEATGRDTVTVATKRGEAVIPRADILLAHEVPPAPVRTGRPHQVLSASSLRLVAAGAWLPPGSTWLNADNVRAELTESENFVQTGWLLRSMPAAGTRRANSALPVASPGMPAAQALDACEAWYRERGQEPQVQIYSADSSGTLAAECAELGPLLRERGYTPSAPTLALTGSTREAAAGASRAAEAALPGLRIEVADAPAEDYVTALGHAPGSPGREAYTTLLRGGEQVQFLTAWAQHPDGSTTPVARCRLAEVNRWAVVTNLITRPDLRRRGAGRAVVRAALATASGRGVRSYLAEVGADNAASLGLFESLGATVSQRYWYAAR
ncbi:GNAT family N-acetyltransferase [Brevibacterium album]|uniref:GNAT family N-acetyltransferase n=1 Tax=Brevibacterium album TaxID=417948 RepID=UPI00048CD950|nr:GNAT family N-acetyltransferase [Brevibacterium album]